jgi:hypothetical protein
LVNDEEATLTELNILCGVKNNVFLGTRIPRPWNLVVFPKIDKNEEEPIEDGGRSTKEDWGNNKYCQVQNTYSLFERQDIIFYSRDSFNCSW